MKVKILAALLVLAAAPNFFGQTTALTAQVVDSQSVAWANGPYTVTFIGSGAGTPYTKQGQAFTQQFSGTLNGSGQLSITVTDVNNIIPANSNWKICVTPAVSSPTTYCVTLPVTGASYSASLAINAIIQPPAVTGVALATAYADSEVTPLDGTMYYRTDGHFRCHSSGAWGDCSQNGAGGPFLPLAGAVPMTGATGGNPIAGGINATQYLLNGTGLGAFALDASQFSGSDASVKVNACLTAASTAKLTCDARALSGSQTVSQEIDVLAGTTLILPSGPATTWFNSMNAGTACMIKQFAGSTITSNAGEYQTRFQNNSVGGISHIYCTDTATNGYFVAQNFQVYDTTGASVTGNGVFYVGAGEDNSLWDNIQISENGTGIALYMTNSQVVCCSATFKNVTASTNYTGIPVQIVQTGQFTGMQQVHFYSLSADHPASGSPNLKCTAAFGNETHFDIYGLYEETSTTDTTTSPNQINGCIVDVFGATIRSETSGLDTAPVFNVSSTAYGKLTLQGIYSQSFITPVTMVSDSSSDCTSTPCTTLGDTILSGYSWLGSYASGTTNATTVKGTTVVTPNLQVGGGQSLTSESGTGVKVQTTNVTTTVANDVVTYDANGNTADSGTQLSGSAGTGVINSGLASQAAYYEANGITVSGGSTGFPCPMVAASYLSAGPPSCFFDDFYTATFWTGSAIGAGSGNTNAVSTTYQDQNHPGNLLITSGTGGSGTGESVQINGQLSITTASSSLPWVWESAVYVPVLPGTTAGSYQAGIANTQNATPWTTGVGFYLSSANGTANDWYCRYASTGTDSTVAATVAWVRLTMVSDGTNVHWYINGTQVCGTGVAVGSMPASLQRPSFSAAAGSGTSVVMAVDYATWNRAVTR